MNLLRRSMTIYQEEGIVPLLRKSISFAINKSGIRKTHNNSYPKTRSQLKELSNQELLSIIQHESHRIEKAVYNESLSEKEDYYTTKNERVEKCVEILINKRSFSSDHPIIEWAIDIQSILDEEDQEFIAEKSTSVPDTDFDELEKFVQFLKGRRSARVWAADQPPEEELKKVADKMVDGAKWAPNSGNRQAWRFKIITEDDKKKLLAGIKEEHTVSAPLLIFIGMDTRVYGDVADAETSIYIDAGAAIMQMVLTAHNAGLGTCWNHFGTDLINSRRSNQEDYKEFTEKLNIPPYIEPIAIVSVGKPKFIPPTPVRSPNERYLIS